METDWTHPRGNSVGTSLDRYCSRAHTEEKAGEDYVKHLLGMWKNDMNRLQFRRNRLGGKTPRAEMVVRGL